MEMSMGELMSFFGSQSDGRFKFGQGTNLVGLKDAELNGKDATFLGICDNGRVKCRVGSLGVKSVKICNLQHPLSDAEVAVDKMHRVFPELAQGSVADTRVERKIEVHRTGVELPCVAGTTYKEKEDGTMHTLGATVDCTDSNFVFTLWTVIDSRVVASRVANIGVVNGRLFVGATFINMFEHGWMNDAATWVDRWLSERLGVPLDDDDESH